MALMIDYLIKGVILRPKVTTLQDNDFWGGEREKAYVIDWWSLCFALFFFLFFLNSSSEWRLRSSITTISHVCLVWGVVEVLGYSQIRAPQFLSSRCSCWCHTWPTVPQGPEHNTTHTDCACWAHRRGTQTHIPTNTSSINSTTPRTFTLTHTSEDPPPHLCKVRPQRQN